MNRFRTSLVALSLLLLSLSGALLWAGRREEATVEAAAEAVQTIATVRHKGFPPALLREAAGVAVFPHVVKGGLLIDGRFGRGVLLVHQPGGAWGRPVFVTLSGNGVGLQAGIESAEVVLVFRTGHSLEQVLKGKGQLKLGGDVAVAVGPVGVEAEAAPALLRKAEVYSYTHDRGLFAGVSLEGDRLQVDGEANEAFYGRHCRQPADVLALREFRAPGVDRLLEHLGKLGMSPAPAPALPRTPPQTPRWP
jgi:lipid-binding SYLF domain-containing protein